jgi:hypothetical protein
MNHIHMQHSRQRSQPVVQGPTACLVRCLHRDCQPPVLRFADKEFRASAQHRPNATRVGIQLQRDYKSANLHRQHGDPCRPLLVFMSAINLDPSLSPDKDRVTGYDYFLLWS